MRLFKIAAKLHCGPKQQKRTDVRSEALQHVPLRCEEAAGYLDFTDAHSGSWCCDSILCVAYNFPGEISGHFMSQTSGYLLKPTFVKCKNLTLCIWICMKLLVKVITAKSGFKVTCIGLCMFLDMWSMDLKMYKFFRGYFLSYKL